GYACGWTSAYPSWILLESYVALHGLTLVDANQHAHMTQQALTAHLQRLKDWQLRGYFQYGGRVDEATAYFTSGRCLMFSQSSGAYNSLAAMLPFKLGVTALPLDEAVSQQRHANLIGGAAM